MNSRGGIYLQARPPPTPPPLWRSSFFNQSFVTTSRWVPSLHLCVCRNALLYNVRKQGCHCAWEWGLAQRRCLCLVFCHTFSGLSPSS